MPIKVPIVSEYDSKGIIDASKSLQRFGVKSQKDLAKAAAGFGLLAGAGIKAFQSLDAGYDAIVSGTGATGDALESLKSDARDVAREVPNSFEDVGTAIADVNTRLGLTGKPLQDMTKKFLDLSRITKTDVATNIKNITRVFGDWSISTEDQAGAMDMLYAASQQTGIGIDELSRLVVQFGAPMRQLGFQFEESVALFGKFEKEGVNVEAVMSGMRMGLGKMAKAGEEPIETFQRLITEITNAGTQGEANAIALEAFGQRAGPDMAAAIREGRFEIGDLVAALGDSEGAIGSAADEMLSFQDRLKMVGNQLMVAAAPAVEVFAEVLDKLVGVLAMMPESLQAVVVGLGAIAIASSSARSAFAAFGKQIPGVTGGLLSLNAALIGGTVAAAAAVAYGISEMSTASERAAETMRQQEEAAEDLANALRGVEDPVDVFREGLSAILAEDEDLRDAFLATGVTIEDFAAAVQEGDGSVGGLTKQLEKYITGASEGNEVTADQILAANAATESIETLADTYVNAKQIAGEVAVVTDDVTEATESATEATGELTDIQKLQEMGAKAAAAQSEILTAKYEDQAEAVQEGVDRINDHIAALEEQADSMRSAADAAFAVEEATDDFNETLFVNTAALNDAEEGTADYRRIQRDTTRSAADLADETVRLARETAEADGKTLGAADAQVVWNSKMIASAAQARGPLRDSILSYIGTVNGIPPEKLSEIRALLDRGSVGAAEGALNGASRSRSSRITAQALTGQAENDLNYLARNRTTTIRTQTINEQIDRRSHVGSHFDAGDSAVVVPGQVFTAGMAGRLHSVEESQRMLANRGGGDTTNVYVTNNGRDLTAHDIARALQMARYT